MRLVRGILAILLVGVSVRLEAEPRIDHAGLSCIAPGKFALILSLIDPEDEVQSAKVYFRSALYPDFYYVEMRRDEKADGGHGGDRFVGILPQVAPETPRIIYYVEVVDRTFESVRSMEFDPVVGECKDKPAAAFFPGEDPGIVIGATTAGASTIPPGFSAVGIVGAITAAGAATGVGGGISTGVVVAAAAGAAGVGGVVVATSPEPATTTTSALPAAPPPTVTTSATTTVAGTVPPPGPTTVPPGPSTITSTTTSAIATTTPGQTTTTPGPTTTTPGPTTSSSSSTTPATSTSSTTTTTGGAPLDAGCFTVQLLGPCSVRVDATCVSLPVDRYEWILDQQNKFRRVIIANGPAVVTQTWTKPDCDTDDTLVFRLTVYRGSESSENEKTLFVPANLRASRASSRGRIQLQSRLDAVTEEGSAGGQVLVDGVLSRVLRSGETVELSLELAPGWHEVEATLGRGSGLPGLWSFSFPDRSRLPPDSLRPVEGDVLASGGGAITFRVSGQPGERLRFRFELEN